MSMKNFVRKYNRTLLTGKNYCRSDSRFGGAEYERIVILNRDEQNNKLNRVPNTVAVWGFCSCTDHQFWGFCQWAIRFPLAPVDESRCPLSLTVRRSERKTALKTASALHQLQNLRSVLLDERQVFLVLAALTFLLNQRSNWTATPFLIEIPPTLHTRNSRRSRHIRPRLQAGTKSDQTWRLPLMIRRDTAQITISFPTPQITPLESKLESLVRTVSGWKMRTERERRRGGSMWTCGGLWLRRCFGVGKWSMFGERDSEFLCFEIESEVGV
ncbi:hypothetical protein M0R45_033925 [Rubus argutus]|uniref:Uncharacterized protein n=1 Tax=Rubus argutus TaxID=59490 RepID=A0AAW1WLD2_RUBAR